MNHHHEVRDVTIGSGGTYSAAFRFPKWAEGVGAYFPAMDDGDVGLEMSLDNGSNYAPIIDPADGADVVILATGSDPGAVDFSDLVRFVPPFALLRFTCAAQAGGARTVKVMFRGRSG